MQSLNVKRSVSLLQFATRSTESPFDQLQCGNDANSYPDAGAINLIACEHETTIYAPIDTLDGICPDCHLRQTEANKSKVGRK